MIRLDWMERKTPAKIRQRSYRGCVKWAFFNCCHLVVDVVYEKIRRKNKHKVMTLSVTIDKIEFPEKPQPTTEITEDSSIQDRSSQLIWERIFLFENYFKKEQTWLRHCRLFCDEVDWLTWVDLSFSLSLSSSTIDTSMTITIVFEQTLWIDTITNKYLNIPSKPQTSTAKKRITQTLEQFDKTKSQWQTKKNWWMWRMLNQFKGI